MSLVKKLSRRETESIYSAANSAVWYSHEFANRLARQKTREEDFVATLVTDGVPLLADRWISLLAPKGIALRVSGVFCHGHPQVVFGSPASTVELADLLVVRDHIGKTRHTFRAVLVQAKMSTDGTHSLAATDPQLALYTAWPPFEFISGGLSRGVRDLRERGKGSRYALVLDGHAYPEEITWPDQCPWASCAAVQYLAADRSFAKLLGDLLLNRDGRAFHMVRPRDDWSKTIKELLEVTAKRTYKRRNIGRDDTLRGTARASPPGVMYFAVSGGFSNQSGKLRRTAIHDNLFTHAQVEQVKDEIPADGDGENQPPLAVRPAVPDEGISTLIIETRDLDP